MKKILIFLLMIFSAIKANSAVDLEQMIKDSDREGVKNILSTIEIDQQTKMRLLDLAQDMVLLRLKTMEIWEATAEKLSVLPDNFIEPQSIEEKEKLASQDEIIVDILTQLKQGDSDWPDAKANRTDTVGFLLQRYCPRGIAWFSLVIPQGDFTKVELQPYIPTGLTLSLQT